MEELQNILNKMKNIEYGYVDENGNKYTVIDDRFFDLYRLQSPKELIKSELGVCWDQVELERYFCEQENIECKSYFIVYYYKECPTHTFLVCKNLDKYYWIENSWEIYKGIYEFNCIEDLLKDVKNKFINFKKDRVTIDYNSKNLCMYEYNVPIFGVNYSDFCKHCEQGKNIII